MVSTKKRTAYLLALTVVFLAFAAAIPSAAEDQVVSTVPELIAAIRIHTEKAENPFSLTVTGDIADSIMGSDTALLSAILKFNGIFGGRFQWEQGGKTRNVTFHDLQYYPGQRIAAAYRTGDTSGLTDGELQTLMKAGRFISSLSGNELDREKAIHDYLCDLASYYTGSGTGLQDYDTAIGAILNGRADCDGFSDAFSMLCSMAGIETRRITGSCSTDGIRGSHMWNVVRINGKWCFVDVTNDNQPSEQTIYAFFNRGSNEISNTHTWDARALDIEIVPWTDNSFRGADIVESYVSGWEELGNEVYRQAVSKPARIMIKCAPGFAPASDVLRLSNLLHSNGIADAKFSSAGSSVELLNIVYYDHFKKVNSEQDALDFLKECKKHGWKNCVLLCSDSLYQNLMNNKAAKFFTLMSKAGFSNQSISYNEVYKIIILENTR